MARDDVRSRLATARPRVAADLDRPLADEALLFDVTCDLVDAGLAPMVGTAFGLSPAVERVVLWGQDVLIGAEDLPLAAALRRLDPAAGRAAALEAEPDLVVVTGAEVAVVDSTVGRPGHAASRAARGEPIAPGRLDAVRETLRRYGATVTSGQVQRHFAVARLAAVALVLGEEAGRTPYAFALGTTPADLLHSARDPVGAWADSAVIVGGMARMKMQVTQWLDIAARLDSEPRAAATARLIRTHPLVTRPRALG
jgi:hypothetical protein